MREFSVQLRHFTQSQNFVDINSLECQLNESFPHLGAIEGEWTYSLRTVYLGLFIEGSRVSCKTSNPWSACRPHPQPLHSWPPRHNCDKPPAVGDSHWDRGLLHQERLIIHPLGVLRALLAMQTFTIACFINCTMAISIPINTTMTLPSSPSIPPCPPLTPPSSPSKLGPCWRYLRARAGEA